MFRYFILLIMSISLLVSGCSKEKGPRQKEKPNQRLVICSDVHYITKSTKPEIRVRKKEQKLQALQTLNSQKDVDLVVFLGDLVELTGDEQNYADAKSFYDQCKLPKTLIAGNHEFIYSNHYNDKGKLIRQNPEGRAARQALFKKVFGMDYLYYTKNIGKYLLVFLAPDKLDTKNSVEISDEQMLWLQKTLEQNKNKPTLIFCHAPLRDTLRGYNNKVNKGNDIVHPAKRLEALLCSNSQVKMWISGHTHTSIKEPSFADPKINLYKGQVMNIHNPTWESNQIYVNSLYLYDDRIEVKTYNLTADKPVPEMDRNINLRKDRDDME